MFGYIRPLECELRVRELHEYRAHYCGLCKTIGRRYGLLARLLLNYDCTFLSAFCAAREGDCKFEQRRCLCHPFRGKQPMTAPNPSTDYAADANVLLAWYASKDGWKDDKRLKSLLVTLLFSGVVKRARRNVPKLALEVEACLGKLSDLERANVACTDEPSHAFAQLMEGIIRHAPGMDEAASAPCGWMFYNLGRWIYLADAWDDRSKDAKRGSYNPFLAAKTSGEQAEFLLNISLTEAQRGYDLVDMQGPHGLVDNIMELGCRQRTMQILGCPDGGAKTCAEETKDANQSTVQRQSAPLDKACAGETKDTDPSPAQTQSTPCAEACAGKTKDTKENAE